MQEHADIRNLLLRISQSDQLAFRILFRAYSNRVYGFALKLTRNAITAEEIVQDIFMKLWINRESVNSIEQFSAYLFTITRNHTFNVLKKVAIEATAKNHLSKELSEAHRDTEEAIQYHESQRILNEAISNLPPQQKLVYSLCHNEGLKYEEVAQRLNISRFTVKTHMQQALRTIKSHFLEVGAVVAMLLG